MDLSRVLEGLTVLRNVRIATFEGIPPVYATYLECRMTGNAPLDHLSRIYEALKASAVCYSGLKPEISDYLTWACVELR